MSSTKPRSGIPVTNQPQASLSLTSLDLKSMSELEKIPYDLSSRDDQLSGHDHDCRQCDGEGHSNSEHRRCHNGRLRRLLLPALIAFVILGGLAAFSCVGGYDLSSWGMDTLVSRAVDDTTNNGGTFVDRKYYLIVIFVGLFIVVILAIMLSAWCCKGAFQNPLCCPCYLCACCGGLACLECIGCGLCAEGLDQM